MTDVATSTLVPSTRINAQAWSPEDLLTRDDLCAYLGVSKRTLSMWITEKTAPRRMKLGRHIRFKWSDVQEWIVNRECGADPPNPCDWDELRQAILTRCKELGMGKETTSAEGGPNFDTVDRIEHASPTGPYRQRLIEGLEQALEWESGTVLRLIAGATSAVIESRAAEADGDKVAGSDLTGCADMPPAREEILEAIRWSVRFPSEPNPRLPRPVFRGFTHRRHRSG